MALSTCPTLARVSSRQEITSLALCRIQTSMVRLLVGLAEVTLPPHPLSLPMTRCTSPQPASPPTRGNLSFQVPHLLKSTLTRMLLMGEREAPMPMPSTRLFTPPVLVPSLSPRVPPHPSKLQSSMRTASTAQMICSLTLMIVLQRSAHHSLDYLGVIQKVALLTTTSSSDLFAVLRRPVSCSLWTNQPSLVAVWSRLPSSPSYLLPTARSLLLSIVV
jgi:hypothetical protein